MKTKRLSIVLLLAVVLGIAAFGAVRMRSTGADVSAQGSEPADSELLDSEPLGSEPPESVFGPHSYTLPPDYEFAPPPADMPPPAVSREEIISKVQGTGSASIVSVDLVTVVKSAWVDEATSPFKSRQWFVVKRDVVWGPLLGGPFGPPAGHPCDVPPEERPPSCQLGKYRGMTFALYDAEAGELTALALVGEERCDIPAEGVEPC